MTSPAPAPDPQSRPGSSPQPVTEWLRASSAGNPSALDALLPAVYAELHRQAERALRREAPGHTLQATALVHEAYLRLVDQDQSRWKNRAQFLGIAAHLMRRILVDHARARHAAKRGGAAGPVTLSDADAVSESPGAEVLALHEALERLAVLDSAQARLVELRYFTGLTIEETAEVLGVSPATVKREWVVARAWLRRELSEAPGESSTR